MDSRIFFILVTAGAFVFASPATSEDTIDLEKYRAETTEKWETDMEEFDATNRAATSSDNNILFVGSSSFRRWENMATDMIPYQTINRGFGGSKWSDLAVYADRLITPHKFRAIVFFVANDIGGKGEDKSPEEVAALAAYVLERVRAHNPDAPAFFIATTPTEKRWDLWPQIKKANSAVRAMCQESENAWFIATESIFFDADNKPRPEFFVDDKLHMNREGYIRWAAAIKSHLDSVFDGAGN